MRRSMTILIGVLTVIASGDSDASPVDEAKRLFDRYVALERAFDPALAELYSSDAVIRNKRRYPTGQVRELTIPASKYKELIRTSLPLAKARRDTNTYSDVGYVEEDGRVRVTATRFTNLKKYSSPMSLLVGPSNTGRWLIYEEISESQP